MLVKILIVVVLSFSLCENTLLGGHNQVDLNDEAVLEHMTRLALFGLKTISEKRAQMLNTNPDEPKQELKYSLLKITSAQSQLVSGMNYFLTIEMQPENCTITLTTNSQDTALDPSSCEMKKEVCKLTIWEQVWLNRTELTDFDCIARQVSVNLGGRSKIPNDDPAVLNALRFAVSQMDKLGKEPVYYAPVVQNAYRQIVNGIKYTIEFNYAPTSCLIEEKNMAEFNSDECKVDETKKPITCVVAVWDKIWVDDESTNSGNSENRYQVTQSNCLQNQ